MKYLILYYFYITLSACNIKIDSKNYLKDRTVCKSCYNKNRRKNYKNNTLIQNESITPH